jgi:Fe-S-cluster containining protein
VRRVTQLDGRVRLELCEAVREAAARAEVRDAVANVYHALSAQVELRRPVCVTSGRCCRFDEFGHRLFVTTMELATFLHEFGSATGACGLARDVTTTGAACPFQREKLCTVHAIRPFGCRIFFCDETSADWQRQQYEAFHAELKRLHERLNVPYFYVEWRAALRALLPTETSL